MKHKRTKLGSLVGALALGLGATLFVTVPVSKAGSGTKPESRATRASQWELKDTNGKTVKLSDFPSREPNRHHVNCQPLASMLGAAILLPLTAPDGWHAVKFDKIPANNVRYAESGLQIAVRESAGAVIHLLSPNTILTSLSVRGRFTGEFRMPQGKQGAKKFDDYVLRLGLIEAGSRTLNIVQQRTAREWIRTLFRLLPSEAGINRIQCFNVGHDREQIGRESEHSASPLFHERIVAVPDADGRFAFTIELPRTIPTIGVWIGSDGDDTRSSFNVLIEQIELETESAGISGDTPASGGVRAASQRIGKE